MPLPTSVHTLITLSMLNNAAVVGLSIRYIASYNSRPEFAYVWGLVSLTAFHHAYVHHHNAIRPHPSSSSSTRNSQHKQRRRRRNTSYPPVLIHLAHIVLIFLLAAMWATWAWCPILLEIHRSYWMLEFLLPGIVLGVCAILEGVFLWTIFGLSVAHRLRAKPDEVTLPASDEGSGDEILMEASAERP